MLIRHMGHLSDSIFFSTHGEYSQNIIYFRTVVVSRCDKISKFRICRTAQELLDCPKSSPGQVQPNFFGPGQGQSGSGPGPIENFIDNSIILYKYNFTSYIKKGHINADFLHDIYHFHLTSTTTLTRHHHLNVAHRPQIMTTTTNIEDDKRQMGLETQESTFEMQ